MRVAVTTACLLLVVGLAYADDGGVLGVGGSVELISPEHSTIRMVREKVDATIHFKPHYRTAPTVRCEFVFRNEGKATTVKMGFPELSSADSAPSPQSTVSQLTHFRSWVDGSPIKTRMVPSKDNRYPDYRAWHVKDVKFAAGQTRTVVDTYEGGMAADTGGYLGFIYILRSGASWKGSIGSAVVKVKIEDMPESYKISSISPKGYTRKGNVISWHLKNLEPKEDIDIAFVPSVTIINEHGDTLRLIDRRNRTSMVSASDFAVASNDVAKAFWEDGRCVITTGGHRLLITPGKKTAILDGKKKISLPEAPYLDGGKTIVPIAAVVRAVGGTARLVKGEQGEELRVSLK